MKTAIHFLQKWRFRILTFVLITILTLSSGVVVSKPADELNALLRSQSDFLARNPDLSNLRAQYQYAQLWYVYRDAEFIFWNYELERRLLQLEQIDQASLIPAANNLKFITENNPEVAPCFFFGSNSLECYIHNVQATYNWIQQRKNQIFSATDVSSWFANWSERWQQTLQSANGYAELVQIENQFLENNPDFQSYLLLQEAISVEKERLLSDENAVIQMNTVSQQMLQELQNTLSSTGYNQIINAYNQKVNFLIESNTTYQNLKQRGWSIANAIENIRQNIYAAIANCSMGSYCFNPQINTVLQSHLSNYNASTNSVLFNSAQLTEEFSQFQHYFSHSQELIDLQQETEGLIKMAIATVQPQIQAIQSEYINDVSTISVVQENMVNLWQQTSNLAQQLGFNSN